MAFVKSNITLRGLSLKSVYLKISRFEYLPITKQVKYTVSAYPSAQYSKDEYCICEYFYGTHDIKIGEAVPDVLAQIYEEIKYRLTNASETALDAEYTQAMIAPTAQYNAAISAIPKNSDATTTSELTSEAEKKLKDAEYNAATMRRRFAGMREMFADITDC